MIALALQYIPAEVWGLIAALIAGFAAWATGRQSGKAAAKTKAADEYRATSERMHNADTGNSDGSGDVEWLRKRGQR